MRKWGEGEKKGQGWMDGGVGRGIEKEAGLDGWESGIKERGGVRDGWMGEWASGLQGCIDTGLQG